MMHKDWSGMEEVPYYRSPVRFQGHSYRGWKNWLLGPHLSVPYENSQFEIMDGYEITQHRSGLLLFFEIICQIARSYSLKYKFGSDLILYGSCQIHQISLVNNQTLFSTKINFSRLVSHILSETVNGII